MAEPRAKSGRGREHAVVFARYAVLQIPGLFAAGLTLTMLVRWTDLTPNLALGLFGLWVLKDLALFPVTRVAYETRGRPHGGDALIGAVGVAQRDLPPRGTGYVKVGAELWRAQSVAPDPVPQGGVVRVREVRGLTLIVEDAEAAGAAEPEGAAS
jgi:membrane protein implicated in regulation of membrane protease activity